MKYKKIFNKILLISIAINMQVYCDNIITFFLKPYPKIHTPKRALRKAKKIARPKKYAKYILRAISNRYYTSGIYSSYMGYLTASDLNGQIIFPRKHKKPNINIVITKHIFPVLMLENTAHHWEISDKSKAKMFNIERKHDVLAKTYFWDAKKVDLPKDNIISKDTIVIIAKPKHVYVPEGITITKKNPQLILPSIYVKKGVNKIKNSLYVFGIKNLFATLKSSYKKAKTHYSQQLKNIYAK